MDERLIVLAVTFLLLVVSLVVLVVTIARARRVRREAAAQAAPLWPTGPDAAERADTFAPATGGMAAVLSQPLRTGAWQPDAGRDDDLATPAAPGDYWDALVEEPSLLVREDAAPVADRAPEAVPQAVGEPDHPVAPAIEAAAASGPVDAGPAMSSSIDDIVAGLEAQISAEPSVVVPAPVVPQAQVQPEPLSEPVASEPVTEPAVPSAPLPAPVIEQVTAPAAEPIPSDAVGDATESVELADLMREFDVEPTAAPVSAPAPAPAPVAVIPDASVDRPQATVPQRAVPPADDGRPRAEAPARPVAADRPTAVVRPVESTDPAAAPVDASARAAVLPSGRHEGVPEHILVAPVEMWFGDHRVGVKAGSRTYEQFQRIAKVLFDDLKASQGRS